MVLKKVSQANIFEVMIPIIRQNISLSPRVKAGLTISVFLLLTAVSLNPARGQGRSRLTNVASQKVTDSFREHLLKSVSPAEEIMEGISDTVHLLNRNWDYGLLKNPYFPPLPVVAYSTMKQSHKGRKFSVVNQRRKTNAHATLSSRARNRFAGTCQKMMRTCRFTRQRIFSRVKRGDDRGVIVGNLIDLANGFRTLHLLTSASSENLRVVSEKFRELADFYSSTSKGYSGERERLSRLSDILKRIERLLSKTSSYR